MRGSLGHLCAVRGSLGVFAASCCGAGVFWGDVAACCARISGQTRSPKATQASNAGFRLEHKKIFTGFVIRVGAPTVEPSA